MTKACPAFEKDEYIEKLIRLRQTEPVQYYGLHEDVKKIVEEYEREKKKAVTDCK